MTPKGEKRWGFPSQESNLILQKNCLDKGVHLTHSMLIAIYHIIKDGVVFKDLGADYYNQFNKERKINAYLKKLKALGWEAPVPLV